MFIPSVKGICTALLLSHNIFSQEVVRPLFPGDQRKDKFVSFSLIIDLKSQFQQERRYDVWLENAINLDFLFAITDYWQLGSTSQVVWLRKNYWLWEEFVFESHSYFVTGIKSKVIFNLNGPLTIQAGGSILVGYLELFHIFIGTQVRLHRNSPVMFGSELGVRDTDLNRVREWRVYLQGGIVYAFH